MKRLLVALAVVLAAVAFFSLNLHQYLSLETLKRSQNALEAALSASPWLFVAGFFALYLTVAALSPITRGLAEDPATRTAGRSTPVTGVTYQAVRVAHRTRVNDETAEWRWRFAGSP